MSTGSDPSLDLVQLAQEQMRWLLQRSATDLEFRRKLLTDPRAAIAEFTGRPLPSTFNVVFIESEADATIVLPKVIRGGGPLGDHQLEVVAGGVSGMELLGYAGVILLLTSLVGVSVRNDGLGDTP